MGAVYPYLAFHYNFWVWATVVEFFESSQSLGAQFDAKVLVILFISVLPILGIIIGIVKIIRKPGVYLRGNRVSNTGIEIGTLTLDMNSVMSRNMWKNRNADNLLEGNWKQKRTIRNRAINFLIALRAGGDPSSSIFLNDLLLFQGTNRSIK